MRFEGRVAVVTGAAQGIGEAYARALASEGASVVVADVDERGQAVADDVGGVFVRTDVSDEAAWVTGQIINVDGGEVFRA